MGIQMNRSRGIQRVAFDATIQTIKKKKKKVTKLDNKEQKQSKIYQSRSDVEKKIRFNN